MPPELITLIVSLATGAGTWLWRKARGEKMGSYRQVLYSALASEVAEAVELELGQDAARLKFEAVCWLMLERWFHLKQSPALRRIVAECVEAAMVEFREKLRLLANAAAARALPGELEKLEKATRDMERSFGIPPESERTVPRLDLDVEIEQPTGNEPTYRPNDPTKDE